MMGGSWFESTFGHPDQVKSSTFEQTALDAVRDQLSISLDPSRVIVSLQRVGIKYRFFSSCSVIPEIRKQHVLLYIVFQSRITHFGTFKQIPKPVLFIVVSKTVLGSVYLSQNPLFSIGMLCTVELGYIGSLRTTATNIHPIYSKSERENFYRENSSDYAI